MDKNGNSLPEEKKHMLLFMMLIQQYEKIAKMNLGEIPNPAHNQVEEDLNSARFAIDTLEMLRNYTKNNLSDDSVAYLEDMLAKLNKTYEEKNTEES